MVMRPTLMLSLQIILVALVVYEMARGIMLSRRLAKIEHQIEYRAIQLLGVLRNVGNLSLLARRHDEDIKALQEENSDVGSRGRDTADSC
jgi:hypothetical protein